jgi:hypothetical protein
MRPAPIRRPHQPRISRKQLTERHDITLSTSSEEGFHGFQTVTPRRDFLQT